MRFRFDKYNPWWNAAARAARQTRLGTSEKFLDDARLDALHLFEQSRRTVFQDVGTYNRYRAKSLRMVARPRF